jgi:hypothetical protein
LSRIDVSFWNHPSPKQFCQSESISAVSFDLSFGDQRKAERMGKANIKARIAQAINKPVPVESRLNDNLQVGLKRLKQARDARQLVRRLLLKMNR